MLPSNCSAHSYVLKHRLLIVLRLHDMKAAVTDISYTAVMHFKLKYMIITGHVSMAVLSDGNPYQHLGIPEGLIFSFPVICSQGTWQIVEVYFDYTITAKHGKTCITTLRVRCVQYL
eukprot:8721-Heterococcus_DN1.PRE.1